MGIIRLALVFSPTIFGIPDAKAEVKLVWDLSSPVAPRVESVGWPADNDGDEYIISDNCVISVRTGCGGGFSARSERAVVERSGITVKSLRIFYQNMTKEEVVQDVTQLLELFKIEGRRIDAYRLWKEDSDRGIVIGNPFVSPMVNHYCPVRGATSCCKCL